MTIDSAGRTLRGTLRLPHQAQAVVLFAHGSGSGRHSPRNQYVAQVLQDADMGTLLIDLLEDEEANDRSKVFDIPLLAERLRAAAAWLAGHGETSGLRLGYFGASTGAGAALLAASQEPGSVGAIVSRGGRPDLAYDALPEVTAPCLLIVGGNDQQVLELNRKAYARLKCLRQLKVIPGASHLFPEPGAGRGGPVGQGVVSRLSLRDDGSSFRAVPPLIHPNREPAVLLQELSWPRAKAVANELPVVVPIAAVEQHGRHLPVFTDSMLLGEVVRMAAASRWATAWSGRRCSGWATRTITSISPARSPPRLGLTSTCSAT